MFLDEQNYILSKMQTILKGYFILKRQRLKVRISYPMPNAQLPSKTVRSNKD